LTAKSAKSAKVAKKNLLIRARCRRQVGGGSASPSFFWRPWRPWRPWRFLFKPNSELMAAKWLSRLAGELGLVR
jgi:hypothetical protein